MTVKWRREGGQCLKQQRKQQILQNVEENEHGDKCVALNLECEQPLDLSRRCQSAARAKRTTTGIANRRTQHTHNAVKHGVQQQIMRREYLGTARRMRRCRVGFQPRGRQRPRGGGQSGRGEIQVDDHGFEDEEAEFDYGLGKCDAVRDGCGEHEEREGDDESGIFARPCRVCLFVKDAVLVNEARLH
jgi:hypothetical protein